MKPEMILPVILVAIDIGAAVVYGIMDCGFGRVWYWLAAAQITSATLFMK